MVRYVFSRCEYIARTHNRTMTLTHEDISKIIGLDCYYCGAPPTQEGRHMLYNGIDRLDNKRGYEPDNCVPACGTCNRLKRQEDFDDFLARARRVVKKWGMGD